MSKKSDATTPKKDEPFSNQAIVTKLLPLTSEAIMRMQAKHVRLSDKEYIQQLVNGYLNEAHDKAFTQEIIAPFEALIKEIYPKYLEAVYNAFDTMEAKIEGEGLTKERDERCKEVSLWFARYLTEKPCHAEDDGFIKLLARELAGKYVGGLPRLDAQLAFDIISGSLQGHMDTVFKEKFGKTKDEVDLDDIDEILKARAAALKSVPQEK